MAATKSKVWQFLKGEEGSIYQTQQFKAKRCLHRFKLKLHTVINIVIYLYIEALHIEIASTSKF